MSHYYEQFGVVWVVLAVQLCMYLNICFKFKQLHVNLNIEIDQFVYGIDFNINISS